MTSPFDVNLGTAKDGPISLSKEDRDVHMQVVGLSRQGKSYFLEHLIRQDIMNGAGVCVIDPHGEMYGNLVQWLAANDMQRTRRIHLISPADGSHSVGFNPLSYNDEFRRARVGSMIDACQKVWGDEQSTAHATLAKLLKMVYLTLAYHGLSLREAGLLTNLQHSDIRDRLVQETADPQLIDNWREVSRLRPSDYVQRFEAVNNRLFDLTSADGVAQMLGQTEEVLDFKTCMDEGHIVLVNLAHQGRIPPSVAQTVGALVTADLFHAAQCRDIATAGNNPFYCYIDECGDYLNETIVKGLDQTAKFGLHYILSHQGLDQLGQRRDDPIRRGVMRGAQNKVVFLQDDIESAAESAELLFGKEYDLEKVKEKLIKPTVVGYSREWLHSEGEAHGTFEGSGSGHSSGASSGESIGDYDAATATLSTGESSGYSESYSSGSSSSYSSSRSETLVPILKDLPGGVHSLDEIRHLATNEVRLLQKRQAFVYRATDRKARQFATADIFPAIPSEQQIDTFFETIREREGSVKPMLQVEQDVDARRQMLMTDLTAPIDTVDFFEIDGDD